MTWQKFVNNAKRTTTGRRIPFRALLLLYYPLRSRIAQRLKLERVPYRPTGWMWSILTSVTLLATTARLRRQIPACAGMTAVVASQ